MPEKKSLEEKEFSDEEEDFSDAEGPSDAEDAEDDDNIEYINDANIDATNLNSVNVEIIIEKKKRGRKPKPKSDIVVEEKIPKTRGRKKIIKEIVEEDKTPKKRGRRPKEKVYSVKELSKTFFEENKNETLILHLPIKLSDKFSQKDPDPNSSNNIDYSSYDNNLSDDMNEDLNILPTQKNLMEKKYNLNLFEDDYYELKNELKDKEIKEKADKEKELLLKNINEGNNGNTHSITESIEYKNIKEIKDTDEDDIRPNKIIKKNLRNILYEFINANNEKTWPETTNIHCWWCCHQFTNTPCALPEFYKKNKFYVSGCFCSFNCCASYNFSKNDDNMWERFSLLNLLYKKLYQQKFVKISLAPPRETLKIFGGYLSIEEFREGLIKNEKTYNVIKPPLISIIPKIEENISQSVKNKHSFPIVNENILNKTQNSLKLKRNKPVTNPNNTLQSFMDLKIL
jgi:hypothetical protein